MGSGASRGKNEVSPAESHEEGRAKQNVLSGGDHGNGKKTNVVQQSNAKTAKVAPKPFEIDRKKIAPRLCECPLCTGIFNYPIKVLPCFHYFCMRCMKNVPRKRGSKGFNCPLCEQKLDKLPPGGIENLPDNYFIQDVIEYFGAEEALRKSRTCQPCGSRAPTVFCTSCRVAFCVECKRKHKNIPPTRNHYLKGIEEYREALKKGSPFERPVQCPLHGEKDLTVFCKTCDRPLCSECSARDHPVPQHQHESLDEAVVRKRTELRTLMENLRQLQARVNNRIKFLEREDQENESTYKHAVERIKKRSAAVMSTLQNVGAKVDKSKRELLDIVDNEFKQREKAIAKAEHSLDNGIAKTKKSYHSAASLLDNGEGAIFVFLCRQVFNEYESNECHLVTSTNIREVRFVNNPDAMNITIAADMLGTIG
ncbi:E3 ubiquitin-protein ligase TRIM33-like [Ptychodera flava]|uniref:E3 ubiquitin-protein ligase TRIM33-like n=1 Tax=Ptychodera flava TaxID=63121 RepID=UPI003969CB3D